MARIRDLGEVRTGRQLSANPAQGELRPYLRVANVFDGYIDTADVFQMRFTDSEYQTYHLRPGDILLNEGQSLELVGRAAMYAGDPPECCFQNSLVRFRAGAGVDSHYMLEVFRFFQQSGRFARIALKTTSIAHLGTARFANLAVPIPPVQIQRSISRLLNQFAQVITTQSRLIARKKESMRAIAQTLFAGTSGSAVLDERLVRLRDVTRELRETNGREREASRVMGVSKFDGIVPMRERTIGTDLTRYKILRPGAFAYNPMRVNIGSIARWMGEEKVLVSPDYVVFEAIPGELDDRFLDHFRRSQAWQRYIDAAGNGSVRVRIYYDDLAAMPLRLPPVQAQRRIADVLDLLDREISLLQRQRDLLDKQKRTVTQKLLAGDVHLKADN